MYLAAAGVGCLGVLDFDSVDVSNLQRQILHHTSDVGRPKTESAAETLHAINCHAHLVAVERQQRDVQRRISGRTRGLIILDRALIDQGLIFLRQLIGQVEARGVGIPQVRPIPVVRIVNVRQPAALKEILQ